MDTNQGDEARRLVEEFRDAEELTVFHLRTLATLERLNRLAPTGEGVGVALLDGLGSLKAVHEFCQDLAEAVQSRLNVYVLAAALEDRERRPKPVKGGQ